MENSSRYIQIIPNSQSFESLNNILVHYDIKPDELTKEYLLIGLRNTFINGYDLKHDGTTQHTTQFYFNCLENAIKYIEESEFNLEFFIMLINATKNNGYYLTNKSNNFKMEKNEVYNRIDGELEYQDKRWVVRRKENGTPDESKPPAEWINYMEFHINEAKREVYFLNDEEGLAQIRKVVALGVRALMIHGCPERVIPEDLYEGE